MRAPRTGIGWLRVVERRFRGLNIVVDLASRDAITLTNAQEAEAVTVADADGATILFRHSEPTISCVLEEFAHALQALKQRFSETDAREMVCLREIEAKECLVSRQGRYGIPEEENEKNKRQLGRERSTLQKLGERW